MSLRRFHSLSSRDASVSQDVRTIYNRALQRIKVVDFPPAPPMTLLLTASGTQ